MSIAKWAVGSAYGPVLTSTELYLLQAAEGCKGLELNPILTHSLKSFHLVFNLANGKFSCISLCQTHIGPEDEVGSMLIHFTPAFISLYSPSRNYNSPLLVILHFQA